MSVRNYFIFVFLIIVADQAIKLSVHAFMQMGPDGEILLLGDWFKLHYILNRGMAFGMSFDSLYGKLGLTLFRIAAAIFLVYLIIKLAKQHYSSNLLWCLAAILAGALGNVIDSVFYGVWLENAPLSAITPWFHGQVIDMFYVDIWEGYLPEWLPFVGGNQIALWPIFNLADASIFVGVFALILFQKHLIYPKALQADNN